MKQTTFFSKLALMHRAMMIGQLLFTAIIFYLVYSKTLLPNLIEHEKLLQVIALCVTAAAIVASTKIFKKKLESINNEVNTKDKLAKYQTAVFLQWALAEIPTLVCGICFLLTGNYAFFALAIVVLVYFAILMPVKSKVAAQLNIGSTEIDEL